MPYEHELFSYSKTHKNIVVIVLDMFSGSHTPYILEQFPYFKEQLDGFVLFPNTISTTNATLHSIATLIGGEYYTTYNMNKRKLNLIQEIDKAFINIANTFAQDNFSVAMMAFVGTNATNIRPKLHNKIFMLDAGSEIFLNYYISGENLSDSIKMHNTDNAKYIEGGQLFSFGVFKFSPKVLHPNIYKDGEWLYKGNGNIRRAFTSIKYSASFYTFTHTINDVDVQNPTFKFFHSMMTHLPFGMYFNDNQCKFYDKKSAWEDYPHNAKMIYPKWSRKKFLYQHFDTEVCAMKYLANYIDLLKKAGIYNNTQIFVVSDHSGNDNISIPTLDKYDTRPDTLLLFKDFGVSGKLKIDSRLMANYDISSIFCENLPNGCPNVSSNVLQNYPQDRELIHTIPNDCCMVNKHNPNEWLITKAYKVRGNIYDEKNWTDISDEKYGIVNVSK